MVLCKGMDEREASLRSIRRSVEEARGGYAAAEAMAEVCGIIITTCSVLTRLCVPLSLSMLPQCHPVVITADCIL